MDAMTGTSVSLALLRAIDAPREAGVTQAAAGPQAAPVAGRMSELEIWPVASAGSAMFNAAISNTDKQNDAIKGVLAYIDREYTNAEVTYANSDKAYGHLPSYQEALARHKAAGARLREAVQADPAGVYAMLERIKASHPTGTADGVVSRMIVELAEKIWKPADPS